MPSTAVTQLFALEIAAGVEFFAGGKDNLDFNPLTAPEELAVQKAWGKNLAFVQGISPTLAAQFADKMINDQSSPYNGQIGGPGTAMVKAAGVAKAIFPDDKTITYPGEPGTIVADWLTPQALFWVKDPDGTTDKTDYGAYSDIAGGVTGATGAMNQWDVNLTAGTAAYLFGNTAGGFYTARQTNEYHSMAVLAQNGLVEIGSTPKLSHMIQTSQVQQKYSPMAIQPLIDLPLLNPNGPSQSIYQYNTPGTTFLMHNFGMRVGVMPRVTGKSRLQWFGMAFYEYNHLAALSDAWRTP